MSVKFPLFPLGKSKQIVDLDFLRENWSGGPVWLETKLYEGASEVDAPDFSAPSMWSAEGLQLQPDEIVRHRQYVAYVEYETRLECAYIESMAFESLPLDWLWQHMNEFKLNVAFQVRCPEPQIVFSFEPRQLVLYL